MHTSIIFRHNNKIIQLYLFRRTVNSLVSDSPRCITKWLHLIKINSKFNLPYFQGTLCSLQPYSWISGHPDIQETMGWDHDRDKAWRLGIPLRMHQQKILLEEASQKKMNTIMAAKWAGWYRFMQKYTSLSWHWTHRGLKINFVCYGWQCTCQ